jgi:hypothetical protein
MHRKNRTGRCVDVSLMFCASRRAGLPFLPIASGGGKAETTILRVREKLKKTPFLSSSCLILVGVSSGRVFGATIQARLSTATSSRHRDRKKKSNSLSLFLLFDLGMRQFRSSVGATIQGQVVGPVISRRPPERKIKVTPFLPFSCLILVRVSSGRVFGATIQG